MTNSYLLLPSLRYDTVRYDTFVLAFLCILITWNNYEIINAHYIHIIGASILLICINRVTYTGDTHHVGLT